jgi:uncharacterized membrane protein
MAEVSSKKGLSKAEKDDQGPFYVSPNRLVALTDGVFAITMTLLALELVPLDVLGQEGAGIIYTYAMGFFSLGVFWSLHHYIFHYIKRSTGLLIWLNIIFLATSSLTPFWLKVIIESHEELTNGFQLFVINMIIILITLLIMWYYATIDNRLVADDFNKKLIIPFEKTMTIGIILMLITYIGWHFDPLFGNFVFVPTAFFLIVTLYGPHKIFK